MVPAKTPSHTHLLQAQLHSLKQLFPTEEAEEMDPRSVVFLTFFISTTLSFTKGFSGLSQVLSADSRECRSLFVCGENT